MEIEFLQIHRKLTENSPAAFALKLAMYLRNGERWVDSLARMKEFVDIYRDLIWKHPLRYDDVLKALGLYSEEV